MKLPWFIPQYRDVEFSDSDNDSVTTKEKEVHIREYRDEANRPWWKFFDEYEYRFTTTEAEKRSWFRWYDVGTTRSEMKLLWKLDFLLAFYSFLGYFITYIDQTNLTNAYVSGLKEDINLTGNDLVDIQVIFLVGNIVFTLPWTFLLPRISLPYALFVNQFIWGIFTLFLYRVENAATFKAFRFIIGAAEACYFPIIHFSFASFYTATEISRRGALFYCGQFLGVLTSGLLQAAASQIPKPGDKISGWQWMFIIDGLISIVIALLALFMHPGTPMKCYSIWLTDDEIRLSRMRMKRNGTDVSPNVKSFFDKETWKKIFTSWHFWILSVCQMCGFNTNSTSSGSFALWLKSLDRYSVGKLNNLTAIPPGLGLIWIMIVCVGADITGKRFGLVIFSFFMNFISNIILAIWDVPENAKWAGFFMAYWSWSQSSVFNPLVSDILRHDSNQRSIEWLIIFTLGLQSSAWVSRLAFPTVEAPRFPHGYATCAGLSLGFNFMLCIGYYFYKRDERTSALRNGIYLYNSKTDEIPEQAQSSGRSSQEISGSFDKDKGLVSSKTKDLGFTTSIEVELEPEVHSTK